MSDVQAPWPGPLCIRYAEALTAINACPGRYHTSPLNQTQLVAEVGVTDGWTIVIRRPERTFTFAYQFAGNYAHDDEIWWGCFQDICTCIVPRNFLGTHRLILPPADLDLDQAEVYTRLRLDGMSPEDSLDIALLL